jgi:long-chain fatty acid transport protein
MRRSALTILCTSLLLTTSAYASGFGLREVSASSMGTSYAGAAASGQRASTMAFNPALLGDVKDFDISLSATAILPTATGDFTTATVTPNSIPLGGTKAPTSIIAKAIIPETAIRMRLNDQFSVGLTISVPWGLMTKYPDTWAGRYYAVKSEIKTYNFTPIIAYQPVPELTVAAGLQVEYIKGNLSKAIDFGTIGYSYHILPALYFGADDGSVLLSADDWAYGYVLGVAWKPNDNLSLGLSYRSKIDHLLSGTEAFTLDARGVGATLRTAVGAFANTAATAKITMPAVVDLGARWRIDDRWTALATIDWTGWSALKQLLPVAANPRQPSDPMALNWKDSWFGSLGAEYKADDQWTLRVGTGYDETPTRTAERSPRIPDSSRIFLSGGVGYRMTDNLDVDFSIAHLFMGHAAINQLISTPENASRGTLIGSVNSGVTLVGVEFTYR